MLKVQHEYYIDFLLVVNYRQSSSHHYFPSQHLNKTYTKTTFLCVDKFHMMERTLTTSLDLKALS